MQINQKGMTLVEILISLLLVSLIIFVTVTFISGAYQSTKHNEEKVFATQKAMSILDELKAFVQGKEGVGALLDDFNQNADEDTPVLTIQDGATAGDSLSANIAFPSSPSKYLYTRQITVSPIGDGDNRLVNVKLFTYKYGKKTLIAEVASVLRTIAPSFAPTQVYDLYLIAIDNIPGWWVYMQNIVPFVQGTLEDIQTRNPGLHFNTHWIRKLSYGRDWQYAPYFNDTNVSTDDIDKVYFYPGQLPVADDTYVSGERPVSYYYLPSLVQARINIDGAIVNGYDATDNPWPYALADTYNNAMRYPDEKKLFDLRVAAGKEDPNAPTYRLLMEDMWQNPSKYRNAIIINLHGELFPFPPIRNYSDPAKDPETFTNKDEGFPRVVTHPTQLRYTNNDPLTLRVYSFLDRAAAPTPRQFLPTGSPIRITLKDITWNPVAGEIKTITGGADLNGDTIPDPYSATPVNAPPCPVGGNAACYTASIDGSDTVIELHRSPLVATRTGLARGLHPNWRLYGMEYIPAPLEVPPYKPFHNLSPDTAFALDLTNGTDVPKNTARWIITVPDGVMDAKHTNNMVTIETRIGDVTHKDDGTMYPTKKRPQNLSTTYAWRGDDTWIFGDSTFTNPGHLPITERWQIIGDPRHHPYSDQKLNQQFILPYDSNSTYPLGTGFNRYFDDFHNGVGQPNGGNRSLANAWQGWGVNGIKNAAAASWVTSPTGVAADYDDGWDVTEQADITATFGMQGYLEVDVNRIMEVFRTVLLRTHTVFTTLSGFSFSYLGMGNEIDYDESNGFKLGVPVSSKPYTGTGGSKYEKSITSYPSDGADVDNTYHVKYIKRNDDTWFAKYWIGDLFPDDVYAAQWDTDGNLDAGTASTDFLRVRRNAIPDTAFGAGDLLPAGTTFVPTGRSTDEEGCTAFMNIGTTPSTFHHQWSKDDKNALVGVTGVLQSPEGVEIANKFNMPFPTTTPIGRPFYLASAGEGRAPDHFVNNGFYDTSYTIGGIPTKGQQPIGELSTTYYDSSEDRFGDGTGSGLVTLRETYNAKQAGAIYTVVNGLDKTAEAGSVLIGKWSVLSLTDAFLRSGQDTTMDSRIRELPRILILPFAADDLNNKDTLNVQWAMNWLRWDGLKYVDAYPDDFKEDTKTNHVVLYSTDSGKTWKNAKTDLDAQPGVRPADADFAVFKADPATTPLSFVWTKFKDQCEGTILLRVETYRDISTIDKAFPLHYSYHQMRIFRRDPDPCS